MDARPQSNQIPTDAALMATMHSDADALEVLIQRYRAVVYSVTKGVLRDAGEAEDVTLDVFFEVFRKAERYDPERGSVRGWILNRAYQTAFYRRQMLKRRPAYDGESFERIQQLSRPVARGMNPSECRLFVRTGLRHLSASHRATLALVCFHDYTLREVSDRLALSIGTTRHHYYRGIAAYRQWLGAQEPADRHSHGHSKPGPVRRNNGPTSRRELKAHGSP